ncbi:MAG: ATP-binding protein [Parachlamydiales bacterium]|nr:ATP-binding protein [Parachlamydiales bacterium]
MKITIAAGKGGTGKSTIASSLAYFLSKKSSSALLDLDVECPNDHILLNVQGTKIKNIYQFKPSFDVEKCKKCGKCSQSCRYNAILCIKDKFPIFTEELCIGCNACFISCPHNAIISDQKEIGSIYHIKTNNIDLITGELKIGEKASGEVVSAVRKYYDNNFLNDFIIIDAAAGIGCPVIASIVNTDYLIAVTEPMPTALNDLKRLFYVANHFKIPKRIIINKYDLSENFSKKIEQFAKENEIPIIGKIPFSKEIIQSNILQKPLTVLYPQFEIFFEEIVKKIKL